MPKVSNPSDTAISGRYYTARLAQEATRTADSNRLWLSRGIWVIQVKLARLRTLIGYSIDVPIPSASWRITMNIIRAAKIAFLVLIPFIPIKTVAACDDLIGSIITRHLGPAIANADCP